MWRILTGEMEIAQHKQQIGKIETERERQKSKKKNK
jgi:hypothetical protein